MTMTPLNFGIPPLAVGSIYTGSGTGTPTELPIGANGYILKSNGTNPLWSVFSASDITTGTLNDARLSSNVALKNINNAFSIIQTIDDGSGTLPSLISTAQLRLAALDSTGCRVQFNSWSATCGALNGVASGGSRASPSATTDGRVFFAFQAFGHDGAAYTSSASGLIELLADGAWSSSSTGAFYNFHGTSNGSTTRSLWMTLKNASLGIGTTPTVGNGLLQFASGTTKANGAMFGDVPVYRFQSYGLAIDTNASSGHQVRVYDDASSPTLAIRAADNVYAQLLFRTYNGVTEDDRFRARADGSGLLWQTWNGSAWTDMLKVSTTGVLAFYGASGSTRQTAAAAATDAATTQTLANSLRTILINLGLAQ